MQLVQVNNHDQALSAPLKVRYCDTFISRLWGLSFQRSLAPDRGILLVQGRESRIDSAIHMLGVWFDLGVVWLNGRQEVVDVRLARRWRLFYVPRQAARFVLEITPQRLPEFNLGDRLDFEKMVRP